MDSALLCDDKKLTYLKTLITGKAKATIAEISYSGVIYNDPIATLQRKFGQPHIIVGAHLDKLANSFPLKMHNLAIFISISSTVSGLVAVIQSLSFYDELISAYDNLYELIKQAVGKLPPNLKGSRSMHTVRHNWQRPRLLGFKK